ncbi:ribosome biogenesis protein BMS1 homolog isoform X1 [Papaver somniferum]|uniref:ribosome biogenesis protein BMS1 homolog isoform X1 n=2 Tax=Papaver somniferum TaxID=3469 RepID=UPI000E7041C8|nr:ribosome biogenesis protein BMS1 homolog isoform X1 [Papaver somniferum]
MRRNELLLATGTRESEIERRVTGVQSDMKRKWDNDDTGDNKRMPKEESAPYVIVVHGPPKVGKSSLIKSLVKHYTHKTLADITNPLRSYFFFPGGQRRIQFVECPNNVNGMIDAAKYADAVIFLIDASYEFEMETFEFLNLLRVHGMPEVMGVLTYLDSFTNVDYLKKTKDYLKDRFKTEISETAEVFCLCGLDHGMYSKDEICELASFISLMEVHPLSARAGHPYVLVDRFEDVTPPEEVGMHNECTRDVILYGYLRGSVIEKGTKVHIAGIGDFHLAGVTRVADPFPLPPVDGHNLEVDLDEVTYLEIESFKPGTYLMFEVRGVPSEIITSRPPCQPILVGGITPKEENAAYMQADLKQHSWHTKSLKTNNPIIVSVGWRRYQTTPIYVREDRHGRYQMLEHIPEDTPCLAVFWGPLAPPNTRVVAVQSLADHEAAFRILATGVVLNNQAAKIVKKSKCIGTPCKIFNDFALIKDMFTSDDEIDQFKDAKVKTESGIGGEVNGCNKGALKYSEMEGCSTYRRDR